MKPEDRPIFEQLTDEQALALTLYGEARGEPLDGIIAVASVVIHRSHLGYFGGHTIKGVCYQPAQFSCFNAVDNPEYREMLKIASSFEANLHINESLQTCLMIAQSILGGKIPPNITASFYKVVGCYAAWADKMVKIRTIGHHEFFREPGDRLSEVPPSRMNA